MTLKGELQEAAAKNRSIRPHSEALEHTLHGIVRTDGREILRKPDQLSIKLKENEIPPLDVDMVLMISHVSGFEELFIDQNKSSRQEDLMRFLYNVENETGLRRDAAIKWTALFASVSETVLVLDQSCWEGKLKSNALKEQPYVIPYRLYGRDLDEVYREIGKNGVTQAASDRLEPLVTAGIPRAKALKGSLMLEQAKGREEPVDKALDLLKEADEAGDSVAALSLGDYYFACGKGHWTAAMKEYSEFGNTSLSQQQLSNVMTLLNQKKENAGTKIAAITASALILLFTIILQKELGIYLLIGALISILLGVITIIRLWKLPYDKPFVKVRMLVIIYLIAAAAGILHASGVI